MAAVPVDLYNNDWSNNDNTTEDNKSSASKYFYIAAAIGIGTWYGYNMYRSKQQEEQQRRSQLERRQLREQMALAAAARAKQDDERIVPDTIDDVTNESARLRKRVVDSTSLKASLTASGQSLTAAAPRAKSSPPKKAKLTQASMEDQPKYETTKKPVSRLLVAQSSHSSSSMEQEASSPKNSATPTKSLTLPMKVTPRQQSASTEDNTPTTSSSLGKKSKKVGMPPPQLLCEALSQVFKAHVTVKQVASRGTWGGQGWRKRPTDYNNNTAPIVLNLQKPNAETKTTIENEWQALVQVFPAIMNESLLTSKLLGKNNNNTRFPVLYHTRAKGLARNGFGLFSPGTAGFKEMQQCLDALCRGLVSKVSAWIQPELGDYCADNNDDDEGGGDLFGDDYNTDQAVNAGSSKGDVGVLGSLFGLLEETISIVTSDFLQELIVQQPESQDLGELLLKQALHRLKSANASKSFSCPDVIRRICGIANLLTLSPAVCQTLAESLQQEVSLMKGKTGRQVQDLVRLAPLLEAIAYPVPALGTEGEPDSVPGSFLQQLESIENYPLCVFKPGKGDDTAQVMADARRTMKTARQSSERALRAAFKHLDKGIVFQWLGGMIGANNNLVNLLKDDLLIEDGINTDSSSRAFLLGLTSALLSFCGTSLGSRFDKLGAGAFDSTYLGSAGRAFAFDQIEDRQRLFQGSNSKNDTTMSDSEFAGATHFFFLSSLAVRVVIHPALRMEGAFLDRYSKLLSSLREASEANTLAPRVLEASKSVVAARLGWMTFLEDSDLVTNITEFTLARLGWLVAMAKKNESRLDSIPDWMCRDSAQWLSHLAHVAPHLLKPLQAEKAVEYATLLLEIGGSSSDDLGERQFSFSPVTLTALIEVASTFVQAGVRRARKKQRNRRRHDDDDEPDDDRDLDVYHSFDRKDLGVTVFTNSIVREKLCPTLLHTFRAVDVVEGLDADRDDTFSKFSARSQISELLLRLYRHPQGDCRASLETLPSGEILSFAATLSSAIAVDFDFASGALEKVRMSAKDRPATARAKQIQKAYLEQSISQATGMFLGMRRFISLLCALSENSKLASYLGGYSKETALDAHHVAELSNMMVHILDALVAEDGGVNPNLDVADATPTSQLLVRLPAMSPSEKAQESAGVIRRRVNTTTEYGLDVSILCHQLLALVAKWHLSAVLATGGVSRVSPLLIALSENEDCDVNCMERVLNRLVDPPETMEGGEVANAQAIFNHDGHVDHATWKHKYVNATVSETQRRNRRVAGQDQMNHGDIAKVGSSSDIALFLKDLRAAVAAKKASRKGMDIEPAELSKLEDELLPQGSKLSEEDYGDSMAEWLVSSEPFRIGADGKTFAHKYDKTARKRGGDGSGKILVKEAKKCHKGLPPPCASAAIFICFAEERMDLCRAVVTGPVDTPYAHGFFVFDVYFPPAYPQVSPMVTFLTTGGGTVRFNPNLYVDGKVCISLLGSTNASDESQRWNPDLSSLAQVMLSIQSQILGVGDPYFNEGNGVPEMMRRTAAGRAGSTKYNNTVRLATLRYAMVEPLRSPPTGFADVTRRHFSMCRQRIVVQARRWMLEARDTSLYSRFQRSYAELLSLLNDESMKGYESLPPLPEDLAAIEKLDSSWKIPSSSDTKPAALPQTVATSTAQPATSDSSKLAYNPWAATAASSQTAARPNNTTQSNAGDSSDDELYS